MEDKISLFDRYIDGELSAGEVQDFESRLKSDPKFLDDFRLYLFILKGLCDEEQQDDIEFGYAMKKISADELDRIIGRNRRTHSRKGVLSVFRRRFVWIASTAAVFVICILSAFYVRQIEMNKVDDIIVEYNYVPENARDGEPLRANDLKSIEKEYRSAPADDPQAVQIAGIRLTMAYLKVHDRKKAKKVLKELSARFADDEIFAAQCQRIISQLE